MALKKKRKSRMPGSAFRKRLARVKLVALDVDGVLTDGRVWWSEKEGWVRSFDIKDGLGLRLLREAGIQIAWITALDSLSVRKRAEDLKIPHLRAGHENKLTILEELTGALGLALEEVAYMGDDLLDIDCLKRVGLACAPADAVEEVRGLAHFVSRRNGGRGAVRELADLVLGATAVGKK